MVKVNIKTQPRNKTYEGGRAIGVSPEKELEKAVLTCMLFENTFYEKGSDIAERIIDLCQKVKPETISALAIKAREDMYLRSIPLFLTRQLARLTKGKIVSETLERVIQRADELSEFLAMYWMDRRQPLSAQVKKGLARAFPKFSAYQLAKYNRNNSIVKLRDVLFLCHAKPRSEEQAKTWQQLIDNTLPIPNTWETQLSAGKDKRETFERLIKEKQLGYFALLRNLRNMEQAGCDIELVCDALLNQESLSKSKILPFRFIAAEQNVSTSKIKQAINQAFLLSIKNLPKLDGITIILVDVSGSMDEALSSRSDMRRLEAAGSLAAILKESCNALVYSFSDQLVKVTSRKRGMTFIDEVINSQENSGTYLGAALQKVYGDPVDRVIILTDEQAHDEIPNCWAKYGYVINLCGYSPSVTYAKGWELIAGWSDKIVNYIKLNEDLESKKV